MDHLTCSHCGVRKDTRNQLMRHIQDHHFKKTRCPLCPKFAVTARNMYRMRRHLEKVHRVDPEKYFPIRRNLKALEDFKPKIPSLFEIKLPFTADPFNVTATSTKVQSEVHTAGTPVEKITVQKSLVPKVLPVDRAAATQTIAAEGTLANQNSSKEQDLQITCIELSPANVPTLESSHELRSPTNLENLSNHDCTPPNPSTPKNPLETSESEMESPQVHLSVENGNVILSRPVTEIAPPPIRRFVIQPKPNLKKEDLLIKCEGQQTVGNVKLIPLDPCGLPAEDPRFFLAGAPSTFLPKGPLARFRMMALKQPKEQCVIKMKASVALGVVQKEEKVTLPDGTIYQLKTTWTKDAEFRESKSAATQTLLPHGNAR